ncbi:carbon-nitrogen hydrolase family protein [Legionella micdadei]|uniref:Nitrilase n=1 Tax=Legionella micdadei TaxID=451 RepID=A0A098GGC3_LEGMI|nr:carbon-nitrogen hydrolase family protein [Legionella micdadei]ARG97860.1 apolipoprotein acyltransferase [Legionella micdadei]ARG99822.1 apolipoprotein acyltransferase [Legionella micdadei]KTD28577.1 nitrilase [Legionella micdadei]NSL19169.1 carbon-nitrogen hydrolase family protein [Legionella micdadei]CEG60531.1 Nitrilase homolog 1 [Legionella micdadei]
MPKVAAVQMISSASVKQNLKQVEQFFNQARKEQADLLVLPENFAFMGMKETDKLKIAEKYGEGEIQNNISQLAKQYDLWVIAGTIPLKGLNQKVRASCLVFDNSGFCVARYDKIHLFDVRVSEQEAHQESLTVERGDELVVVDTPVGRIGLTVCYDLRFPELYQQLLQRGAELFTVPSAFTAVTGSAHWEVLLRARAIENLSYVIAANQGGQHDNGRQTYGHTMVVEPWGKVLTQQQTGEGMIIVDIDLQRLQQLRRQFPSNEHHVLLDK